MNKIKLWIAMFLITLMVLIGGCEDVSGDAKPAMQEYPTPEIIPGQTPSPPVIPENTIEPVQATTPQPQETPLHTSTPMVTEPPAQTIIPLPTEPPLQTEIPSPTVPPTEVPTQSPTESPEPGATTLPGLPYIIITEIMYNPKSPDGEWEWIEIYNRSSTEIHLTGWVIDDGNKTPHAEANIVSGMIVPGETGILFNNDVITPGEFEAAWGQGINLIPVIDWGSMGLNNTGDKIGIWDSFASYEGDHELFANTCCFLEYSGESGWPEPDGYGSLYLADISMEYTNGYNWRLSDEGIQTTLGMCYQSTPGGTNSGEDIGSPRVTQTD